MTELILPHPGFDDAHLALLKQHTKLRNLNLSHAKITDARLANLQNLTQLEKLNLN